MEFNSLKYIVFLFTSVVIYYLLPVQKLKCIFLLILSLIFYSFYSVYLTIYMLIISLIIYWIGRLIFNEKNENIKRLKLILGLILSISWIIVFKIAGKFSDSEFLFLFNLKGVFCSIGISYYSFKLISYLIEIYWEKMNSEKSIINFFLYISFFPQIPSGPIQRPQNFLEQLNNKINFNQINLWNGLQIIIFGFFKKLVVADRIGIFINPIYEDPTSYSSIYLIYSSYLYLIQLYCDFSGLTDIAIGTAKLFGIYSPKNFDQPSLSLNIPDFWRRWHISLSEWLRDYLFIPLRMGLRNLGEFGLILSILINMIVIGLWHGFTLSFLGYGLLQGIYIIISIYTLEFREKIYIMIHCPLKLRNFIARLFTIHLTVFSLLFFRIQDIHKIKIYLRSILEYKIIFNQILLFQFYLKSSITVLILYLIVEKIRRMYFLPDESKIINTRMIVFNLFFYSFLLVCILFAGVFDGSTFIYNQF